MVRIFGLLFLSFLASSVQAQFVGYSLKGGPSVGIQQWDGFDRQPLFGYHFDLQIESLSDVEPRTLYASLGYHQRGSAIRYRRIDLGGNPIGQGQETTNFVFNNAVLALGAKQTYALGQARGHIALAIRGEYNINTDLAGDLGANRNLYLSFPQDEFVIKGLYGIDLGAGLDISINPSLDALLELRVSPDFSRQYFQPPLQNVILPGSNNPTTIGERTINNITFELSAGIRFVRYNGPYEE